MSTPPAFGKELREQEFYLTSDYTHLNNGSYGSAPKKIVTLKRQLVSFLKLFSETNTSNNFYSPIPKT